MAAPQLENGYLRVANELAEAMARARFSGQESQVIWAVVRLTYGFNCRADHISNTRLSALTGLPRNKVAAVRSRLLARRVLREFASPENGTTSPRISAKCLGLNKNYEQWIGSPQNGTSCGVVPKTGLGGSPENGTSDAPGSNAGRGLPDPLKTKSKKRQKNGVLSEHPPESAAADPGYPPPPSDADQLRQVWATVPLDLRDLITDAMKALALTRKRGKLAESMKLSILRKLLEHDPARIKAGVTTYLDREYHLRGKREEYLFGIIRNATPEEMGTHPATVPKGNGTGGPPAAPRPVSYGQCKDLERRTEAARLAALKEKQHGRQTHPDQGPGGSGAGPAQSPAHAGQPQPAG